MMEAGRARFMKGHAENFARHFEVLVKRVDVQNSLGILLPSLLSPRRNKMRQLNK